MLQLNISLPSKAQWKKILTAVIFSFLAGLLGTFMVAGGIQDSWEATWTLLLSSAVSASNGTLYALWVTFFKSSEE